MRKIALLAALAAFLPVAAMAQSGAQIGAGQVWGNSTAARAPGKAENVTAILDRALGSTRGAILERGASGWAIVGPGTLGKPWVSNGAGADPAYQTLGIVGGGTNCAAASATCLDNITGFSSTGMMARTGAGAYSFRTITGTANAVAVSNGDGVAGNPTLSLPAVVNIATSLALNGCTIGSNVFCATGTTELNSTSAVALSVGSASNRQFTVNASAGSVATGLTLIGFAAGGGVALTAISSGTNEGWALNAKGSGTMNLNNSATGPVVIGAGGGGVTLSSALTYGGVTLSNSVVGTGSMALSASPGFTGTPTAPTAAAGNNSTQIATTAYADRKPNKVVMQTFCPSGCTTTIAGGASGTYTPTTGMLWANLWCLGGGGGGGGASNSGATTGFSAGGGGAGSWASKQQTAAQIGASLTVFIGTAGTAGTTAPTGGGAGGDSCFTTSTCSSGQKVAGKGATGGSGAGATGTISGGAGGVAGTGDVFGTGQPGSNGVGSANTGTTGNFLSGGGSSILGGAQAGYVGAGAAGNAGTGFGAGGTGGSSFSAGGAQAGGAGTAGFCYAEEYVNQ